MSNRRYIYNKEELLFMNSDDSLRFRNSTQSNTAYSQGDPYIHNLVIPECIKKGLYYSSKPSMKTMMHSYKHHSNNMGPYGSEEHQHQQHPNHGGYHYGGGSNRGTSDTFYHHHHAQQQKHNPAAALSSSPSASWYHHNQQHHHLPPNNSHPGPTSDTDGVAGAHDFYHHPQAATRVGGISSRHLSYNAPAPYKYGPPPPAQNGAAASHASSYVAPPRRRIYSESGGGRHQQGAGERASSPEFAPDGAINKAARYAQPPTRQYLRSDGGGYDFGLGPSPPIVASDDSSAAPGSQFVFGPDKYGGSGGTSVPWFQPHLNKYGAATTTTYNNNAQAPPVPTPMADLNTAIESFTLGSSSSNNGSANKKRSQVTNYPIPALGNPMERTGVARTRRITLNTGDSAGDSDDKRDKVSSSNSSFTFDTTKGAGIRQQPGEELLKPPTFYMRQSTPRTNNFVPAAPDESVTTSPATHTHHYYTPLTSPRWGDDSFTVGIRQPPPPPVSHSEPDDGRGFEIGRDHFLRSYVAARPRYSARDDTDGESSRERANNGPALYSFSRPINATTSAGDGRRPHFLKSEILYLFLSGCVKLGDVFETRVTDTDVSLRVSVDEILHPDKVGPIFSRESGAGGCADVLRAFQNDLRDMVQELGAMMNTERTPPVPRDGSQPTGTLEAGHQDDPPAIDHVTVPTVGQVCQTTTPATMGSKRKNKGKKAKDDEGVQQSSPFAADKTADSSVLTKGGRDREPGPKPETVAGANLNTSTPVPTPPKVDVEESKDREGFIVQENKGKKNKKKKAATKLVDPTTEDAPVKKVVKGTPLAMGGDANGRSHEELTSPHKLSSSISDIQKVNGTPWSTGSLSKLVPTLQNPKYETLKQKSQDILSGLLTTPGGSPDIGASSKDAKRGGTGPPQKQPQPVTASSAKPTTNPTKNDVPVAEKAKTEPAPKTSNSGEWHKIEGRGKKSKKNNTNTGSK